MYIIYYIICMYIKYSRFCDVCIIPWIWSVMWTCRDMTINVPVPDDSAD